MKVAVITSGFLPVPASKGGAVECLLMNIINENETAKKVEFDVFSIFDENAKIESKKYNNSNFYFIKPDFFVKFMDNITFFIAKKILRKKNSQSYRFIFQRLYYFYKCSTFLKKYDFDKVILENHPSQYLTLKWKKNYIKYKDNYYYHCHNQFPGMYGCSDIIRKTKRIFCVSSFRKNNVKDYMKMDEKSFSVLYNAIDTKTITKKATNKELNELKKIYNINKNEKILLFVGRIVPGKGVPELIEAMKILNNKDCKLLLLGSSLNSLNVKNRFEEDVINKISNDIKDKIIFTGFINYKEIYKYYSLADIAVLPSVMEDSAPLTIIESLNCGLPIITTDSGGIPEYAKNGTAIIIKRNKDLVENLAKSIDDLLTNSNKMENMSKKAYEVSKEFTMNSFYKNFLKQIDYEKD